MNNLMMLGELENVQPDGHSLGLLKSNHPKEDRIWILKLTGRKG
jgi:hypothetical protein